MPELLAPGVYVVEVTRAPQPIEGVSTSTERVLGSHVISEFRRLVDQLHVGSGASDKDSAIALLELMAWLADTLARRLDQLESEAYLSTAGLTAAALTLASKIRTQPGHGVLKPIRYFEGQLLDADDLEVEVDYTPSQCRHKFGAGIVCGLEVSAEAGNNGLRISPGYAIDNRGRNIVVNEPLTLTPSQAAKRGWVILRPERHCPRSIVARALVDCEFLVVENPERDDLLLGCLEQTSRGWQLKKSG
jgi:hypothetical protein